MGGGGALHLPVSAISTNLSPVLSFHRNLTSHDSPVLLFQPHAGFPRSPSPPPPAFAQSARRRPTSPGRARSPLPRWRQPGPFPPARQSSLTPPWDGLPAKPSTSRPPTPSPTLSASPRAPRTGPSPRADNREAAWQALPTTASPSISASSPGFMIQGGDPVGDGRRRPRLLLQRRDRPQRSTFYTVPGRLAMANSGPNTNGYRKFYITEDAVAELDGKYTIFGQCDASTPCWSSNPSPRTSSATPATSPSPPWSSTTSPSSARTGYATAACRTEPAAPPLRRRAARRTGTMPRVRARSAPVALRAFASGVRQRL